jgi:Methyltransferase domain
MSRSVDQGIHLELPSLERFNRNIQNADLTSMVETIHGRPFEVRWDKPIGLLLIDGLHDYFNVARDFFHFEPWVVAKGYIAFHDYADYFPGVKAFVNEILGTGKYRKVHCVRSMMVVQKQPLAEALQDGLPPGLAETSGSG